MKFDNRYPDNARPNTAAFVILRRQDKVAMVLRKNTGYMDGYYGLPAGKGEWNETFTNAAAREAKEEAGVNIKHRDLKVVHVAHRHGNDGKVFMEWVDVYFEADRWDGEPYNAEEDKAEKLDWLSIDNLPKNIVPHQLAALNEIAKGNFYSEYGWPEAS